MTTPVPDSMNEHMGKKKQGGACSKMCAKIGEVIKRELVPEGIDQKMFLPLLLVLLCEGITGSSVTAYIGYMIVDIGAASTTDSVGTWTGWLNACFSICQFFSSFVFGWLSDKIGRRPILLIGVFGNFVTVVAFGFAPSIFWAMFLRSFNGLLNGNVGIVKTCIAEMTTPKNRVKAFTYIGLMFGVGSILGSSIGGATARPAVEYSETFDSSGFFGQYPYVLPNVVVGLIVLITFISAFLFVKETGSGGEWCHKKAKNKMIRVESEPQLERSPVKGAVHEDGQPPERPASPCAVMATKTPPPEEPPAEARVEEAAQFGVFVFPEDDIDFAGDAIVEVYPGENHEDPPPSPPFTWRDPVVAVTCYTLACAFQNICFMMISTWTIGTIGAGGLDFTAANVGTLTAASGVAMTISLIFFVPRIVSKLGMIGSIRTAALLLVPVMIVTPFCNDVAREYGKNWAVWLYIILCVFLWQSFAQLLMNSSIVLISNSVPAKKLAMVNGAGQAFGAAARSLVPLGVGPLLTWCLSNGLGFPFNQVFPFLIDVVLLIIYFCISFLLPKTINQPFAVSHPGYVDPPEKPKKKRGYHFHHSADDEDEHEHGEHETQKEEHDENSKDHSH